MRRLVSAPAQRDIACVLDWSREHFGADARRRSERLPFDVSVPSAWQVRTAIDKLSFLRRRSGLLLVR